MSDFTNELLKLSEMREKGLISQEEFEAAKAKLFSDSGTGKNESTRPPEMPTIVMAAVPPPAPASVPPTAAAAASSAASKVVPPGIAGWSWGAFLWNWIWAIFNNTWIGLLALIPGVNIIMIFVLGAKGREWAWKNKQWDSVEHFNRVQRKWSMWGIGLVLASLLLGGLLFAFSMFFLASEGSKFSPFDVPSGMEAAETIAAPEVPVVDESESADMSAPAVAEDAIPAEAVATDTVATDTVTEAAAPQNTIAEETVAQDAAADQDQKHQEELARTREEAKAAKAEAAKAKKEALKAEKALAEQRRLQEEERIAQELAEQEQVPCPYSRAQPLICSSRQGQPAYCDWNFKACGTPRLLKKESKTTCDGKMRTDPENNQIVVVEGCRGKFIPEN